MYLYVFIYSNVPNDHLSRSSLSSSVFSCLIVLTVWKRYQRKKNWREFNNGNTSTLWTDCHTDERMKQKKEMKKKERRRNNNNTKRNIIKSVSKNHQVREFRCTFLNEWLSKQFVKDHQFSTQIPKQTILPNKNKIKTNIHTKCIEREGERGKKGEEKASKWTPI